MTEHERPLDVARIAFVTRRFHELRGLTAVGFGCSLVLAVVLTRAFDRPGSPLQLFMLAMMIGQSFTWPLEFWYRRTFGHIVVTPTAEFAAGFSIIGLMLGVYGDFFLQATGRQIPSLAAVALGLYALSVLARDGRRRLYYVLALAAAVAGVMVTANAPAGSPRQMIAMAPVRAHAFMLAYTWVGLSHAIAALLDHRLLARTLTPRPPTAGPEPGALILSASNGRFRALVAALVLVGSAGSLALDPESSELLLFAMPPFAFLFGAIMQFRRPVVSHGMDRQAIRRARLEYQAALIGGGSHAIWLAVAAAGATDSWMLPHGRFLLLPLTLAAWSAWVAIRDWPDRRHYLIGAVTLAAYPLVAASLPTSRAYALLLAVVSGSLVVEGLLDHRLFTRHAHHPAESRGEEPSPLQS